MNRKLIRDDEIQYEQTYFSYEGRCFVTIFNTNLTIHTLNENIYQFQTYSDKRFNDKHNSKVIFLQDYIIYVNIGDNKVRFIRMSCLKADLSQFKIKLTDSETFYNLQQQMRINKCDLLPNDICKVFKRSYFTLKTSNKFNLFNSNLVLEMSYDEFEIILIDQLPKVLINQGFHDSAFNKLFKIQTIDERELPDIHNQWRFMTTLSINRFSYSQRKFSKQTTFRLQGSIAYNREFNCLLLLTVQSNYLKLLTTRGQNKVIRIFTLRRPYSNIKLFDQNIIEDYCVIVQNQFIFHNHVLDIRTANYKFSSQANQVMLTQRYFFELMESRIKIYDVNQ